MHILTHLCTLHDFIVPYDSLLVNICSVDNILFMYNTLNSFIELIIDLEVCWFKTDKK